MACSREFKLNDGRHRKSGNLLGVLTPHGEATFLSSWRCPGQTVLRVRSITEKRPQAIVGERKVAYKENLFMVLREPKAHE
jgi:hypothetical protein